MRTKIALTLMVLGALAQEPVTWAKGAGVKKDDKKEERGGGSQSKTSKPSGGGDHQPKTSKPSGGGDHKVAKPTGGKAGSASYRPQSGHAKPPVSKPSGSGAHLPQVKPSKRPETKPQRPTGSAAGVPSVVTGDRSKLQKRPSTPRAERPPAIGGAKSKTSDHPDRRPDKTPDRNRDFLGLHPEKPKGLTPSSGRDGNRKPDRPTTQPGRISDNRKPDRPTTQPGHIDDNRKPDRSATMPGQMHDRSGFGRGEHANRAIVDYRPGKSQRPLRHDRPERWQNVHQSNVTQWNDWRQSNTTYINNFQASRTSSWSSIDRHYHERGWASRYGSDDYSGWHRNVYDYRRHRGTEIWYHRQDYWNDCFDYDWWRSCWWRPRPLFSFGINISPWWWWRPFTWDSYGAFYGARYAAQPIYYDPGTTVIYEGDTYYVNGQPYSSAIDARRVAIQLATPDVDEIPVPEPVAEGQPETWLPIGVWALTQQEQGDATMFMQLSVDKDGIVAGAYKNVMTGDEQPIVGRLDRKTQRIAWHVGEATQTVYEAGIASFENDVVSVFVHFGESETQTWLLVRLPSPELPPGTVKLPELAKQ